MGYDEVNDAISLINGQRKTDEFLEDFKLFFRKEFNLNLLAFSCKEDGGYKKVKFVLWDKASVESFYISTDAYYGLDSNKTESIKKEFSFLCKKYNVYSDYFDVQDYVVVPKSIKEEIAKIVLRKTETDIHRYITAYPAVKKALVFDTTVYIFYETDNDIILYADNGLNTTIKKGIYEMLGNADEFNVVDSVHVVFTSVQTLNEKYRGNMYLYLL